jgi:CheY-like chemotaxis protein
MLDLLKSDFLDSLSGKSDQIEELVLKLAGQNRQSARFEEVYRLIHSLKGAGGTHGLPIVSAICHYFEDLLVNPDVEFNQQFITHALAINDLLKQISRDGHSTGPNALHSVAERYEELQKTYSTGVTSILILESSKTMCLLLQRFLAGYHVRLTLMQDGLLALQRLIHEPVDLIIVSVELANLKGPALITAIQMNKALNANTPVIFLTSQTEQHLYSLHGVTVLPRTPELPALLEPIIASYCQKRTGLSGSSYANT